MAPGARPGQDRIPLGVGGHRPQADRGRRGPSARPDRDFEFLQATLPLLRLVRGQLPHRALPDEPSGDSGERPPRAEAAIRHGGAARRRGPWMFRRLGGLGNPAYQEGEFPGRDLEPGRTVLRRTGAVEGSRSRPLFPAVRDVRCRPVPTNPPFPSPDPLGPRIHSPIPPRAGV